MSKIRRFSLERGENTHKGFGFFWENSCYFSVKYGVVSYTVFFFFFFYSLEFTIRTSR
ncbi:hypothetical protein LCGC14_1066530 [marine sediment metagenome]|uniref:Uncharacterized protein n=1 Tax=marine sediment metagenome TaxID=412755 RepID=A0A0F9MPB8_9ZZZZ